MSESLLSAGWHQVADNLLAIRRSGSWREDCASFDVYVVKHWSLSKSRAKALCQFSTFCAMCRDLHLPVPSSPDNIMPILKLKQRGWIDTWRICLDLAEGKAVNATHCKATMDYYGIGIKYRCPPAILKARKLRKATNVMADMGDGEKLVEEIGRDGLGANWDAAVEVMIDADQAKMNET